MANNDQLDFGGRNSQPRRPAADRGRPLLALLVIVILAGVVGWFWLARDPEARQELARTMDKVTEAFPEAAGVVDSVKSSVSGLVDEALQRSSTPPPPPASTAGTIPGAPPPLVAAGQGAAGHGGTGQADGAQVSGSFANATTGLSTSALSTPAGQEGTPGAVGSIPANSTAAGSVAVNGTLPATAQRGTFANGTTNGNATVTRAPEGTDPFTGGIILPGGASERGTLTPEGATPPPDAGRKDDMVVRVAFIEDLAQWMVGNYQPSGKNRGSLQVSLQAANLRYGVGMKGLYWIGDDLPKGRSEALQYVFTPSMLDALYRLYIDRFMEGMAVAGDAPQGRGKPLSPQQRSDMYVQYAKRFRGLSGALQGVAALPDMLTYGDNIRKSAQAVVEANNRYSELVFQQDQAREAGNDARVAELAPLLKNAASAYQQAVIRRERSQEAFAKAIARNPMSRGLDDETRVYVGLWVERRVRDNADKVDAALQAATIFLDLAQRFERAAGVDN